MKTTVQKSALVTALLLLTACAGGPGGSSISLGIGGFGSHIGLGTSYRQPHTRRRHRRHQRYRRTNHHPFCRRRHRFRTSRQRRQLPQAAQRTRRRQLSGTRLLRRRAKTYRSDDTAQKSPVLRRCAPHRQRIHGLRPQRQSDTPTGLPQQPAYRQLTAIPAKPRERPSEIMFQTAFLYRFKQRRIRICF